jgi:NMD protein affecting ribosome stability and mRNA decay
MPEPPYPAYSGPANITCAKCHVSMNPATKWLPPLEVVTVKRTRFVGEALLRVCKNCGYTWAEAPFGG